MKIYLVRHADYEKTSGALKGRLPVNLSKQGIIQANRLKDFFAQLPIEMILSSAVMRCKQTSEIIANNNTPLQFDKRLLEALTAYQGYMDGVWADHAYTHQSELGGETTKDVQQRMVDFYQELIKKEYQQVVVCSHGDPLQFLYLYLNGEPLSQDYSQMGDSSADYQSKAGVRLVELVDGKIIKIKDVFKQPEYQ